MELENTPIDGLYIVHQKVVKDNRGVFRRLFAEDDLALAGRATRAIHVNTSTSILSGTLRGLHFQYPPFSETKIICCTAGKLWDVAVDLRPGSRTRFHWYGITLSQDKPTSFLVPEGFGHGFITMEPNTTILYFVSQSYSPSHESGIKFDDPLLSINWPIAPTIVSDKDMGWARLEDQKADIDLRFGLV